MHPVCILGNDCPRVENGREVGKICSIPPRHTCTDDIRDTTYAGVQQVHAEATHCTKGLTLPGVEP